jgi:DNA-binding transcriptional LysR family regulator
MEPTPFALQLAEPVAYAMGALHTALNQQVVFDPATSTRSFTLAMTDIGEIYFTPRLMEALSGTAPGVTISTLRNNTATNLREELEAGHVDIAIGLLPQLKAGVFQRRLFLQRYVCLFSKEHPLARKRSVSLKDFSAADHVQVQAAGTGHGKADDVMAAQGIQRRIRLQGAALRGHRPHPALQRHDRDRARAAGAKHRRALRAGVAPSPGGAAADCHQPVLAREGAPRSGQPVAARIAVRQLRGWG